MKTKATSDDAWVLPKETRVQKAARLRKLRAILKKGMGMSPKELKDSLWPGYAETYRSERGFRRTAKSASLALGGEQGIIYLKCSGK